MAQPTGCCQMISLLVYRLSPHGRLIGSLGRLMCLHTYQLGMLVLFQIFVVGVFLHHFFFLPQFRRTYPHLNVFFQFSIKKKNKINNTYRNTNIFLFKYKVPNCVFSSKLYIFKELSIFCLENPFNRGIIELVTLEFFTIVNKIITNYS